MCLKFSDKTSLQHASRAATADQSKSMKLPPLISPYKSKLVLLLADGKQVWPEEPVALHACKFFSLGGMFGVEQLLNNADVLQRMKTELAVWDVNVNFLDLKVFKFEFNNVKILKSGSLKILWQMHAQFTTL